MNDVSNEISSDEVCAYLLIRISQLKDTIDRLKQQLAEAEKVNEGLMRDLATLARTHT